MNKTIDVGYDFDINSGITVNVINDNGNNISYRLLYSDIYKGTDCYNNNPDQNNPDPDINATSPDFQQEMRYLDSKKDLLGLKGFDPVIKGAYNLTSDPQYTKLKNYKKKIISCHSQFIETKSWAKTKTRNSLEVDLIALNGLNSDVYLFRESSMDLTEDIVDANNTKITPKDMACFSNTILDPLKRSFLISNAEHFPEQGTSLVFNKSFIDGFLRFFNCTNVSSRLINETALREDRYTYNYEYDISYLDGTRIVGTIIYPNNPNNPNDPNYDINNRSIINKYVIGNENKRLTIQSNNAPNGDRKYKEHIVQIKEMGDVLQVFTMLVWMMYMANEKGATVDVFKKTFLMTTIDSIVFILCIMFRLPCIVYEFKEESDQDIKKPNNGRTRYLQRYRPVQLTFEEKKKLILADITNHNDKIITVIKLVLSNNLIKVNISKSESVYLNPDFLNQLIEIIKYLNQCAESVVTNTNNLLNFDRCDDFVFTNNTTTNTGDNTGDNTDNTDNTDIPSPVNDIVNNVLAQQSPINSNNETDYLKKLEMLLKLNCKIGELFYKNNNGNIFAMNGQKTLTSCKNIGSKCYFACNKNNYKTNRGSKPFQLLCQENKVQSRGGGDIDIDSTIIENITLTQQGTDINNFYIDVTNSEINMHEILLGDLYDNLKNNIKLYNDTNSRIKLNTHIDGYDLYSIYSLLAHDYDILNQVFYPKDKNNEIPNDILSNLKDTDGNDISMDNFTQYYINEIASSINGIKDDDNKILFYYNNRYDGNRISPRQTRIDDDTNEPRRDRDDDRNELYDNREKDDAIKYVIEELFTQESFTDNFQPNNNMVIEEEVDNNKMLNNGNYATSVSDIWGYLSPPTSQYADYGGTRKNKRKQPKKYKSYNRKNKTKTNRKSKKHNKSKNKRKPNKSQRKPNKSQRKPNKSQRYQLKN